MKGCKVDLILLYEGGIGGRHEIPRQRGELKWILVKIQMKRHGRIQKIVLTAPHPLEVMTNTMMTRC